MKIVMKLREYLECNPDDNKDLQFSLYSLAGLTGEEQVEVDYVENRSHLNNYKFQPGWSILEIGDPSDPIFGLYLDGKLKAGYYISHRGKMFIADGYVVEGDQSFRATNNTEGWLHYSNFVSCRDGMSVIPKSYLIEEG